MSLFCFTAASGSIPLLLVKGCTFGTFCVQDKKGGDFMLNFTAMIQGIDTIFTNLIFIPALLILYLKFRPRKPWSRRTRNLYRLCIALISVYGGCLTVPAAAGNTKRQIKFITDFGTTCLHIIPSYATRLAEVMYEMGLDPRRDTKLHTVCIGAEPHSEEQRRRIEQLLGVKAYNCFGMSEMNGPGVAFECTEQNGLHIWEDNVIVEIIDPVTLQPVKEGEVGEMVLTTINREAMPLLRYRTRDLTCVLPGECPCGRTHKRLARFKGRSDDMIILKGVNLFPIQIEKILMQFKELGSNYLITIETVGNNDEMLIEVELSDLFTDDYSVLQRLTKEITRQLKDELLLTPHLKLVAKGSLPVQDGKAVRVKDLRKLC